jgi:hypothetical protein
MIGWRRYRWAVLPIAGMLVCIVVLFSGLRDYTTVRVTITNGASAPLTDIEIGPVAGGGRWTRIREIGPGKVVRARLDVWEGDLLLRYRLAGRGPIRECSGGYVTGGLGASLTILPTGECVDAARSR